MIFPPIVPRRLLLLLSVAALTACGAVGKGNKPVSITIAPLGSVTPTTAVTAYQCVSGGLSGLLKFDDGQVADYSGRMTWTSSNPTIVQIGANTGVLMPEASGTAIITATYYTLQASIKVEVRTLAASALTLEKLDQDAYTPIDPGAGFTIVTNTTFVPGKGDTSIIQQVSNNQQLVLVADENGAERNVTGAALFSLKDSGGNLLTDSTGNSIVGSPVAVKFSTSALTLASTDKVSTSPYTLEASLDSCANPLTVSVPLNTANIQTLTLQPELDAATGPDAGVALGFADSSGKPLPLVKHYAAERLKLTAQFANGQTQDLSLFGQFTSSDPTVAAFDFATLSATDANDVLTTLNSTAAPSNITKVSATFQDGSFASASSPLPTSNTLTFTTTNGTLDTISVAPLSGNSVTATSTIDTAQFHAIGLFDTGSGTSVSQDITRLATFSVFSDPTDATLSTNLATINSTPSVFSGRALPANNNTEADIAGGTVYIGAVSDTGGTTPVTITAPTRGSLTVKPQPDAPNP